MPCPVCQREPGSGSDHRMCLATLFRNNTIQSVYDWMKLCEKPKTIFKGKRTIKVKKEDIE